MRCSALRRHAATEPGGDVYLSSATALGAPPAAPASLPAEAQRLVDVVKASPGEHHVMLATISPALSDFPLELLREHLRRKHPRVLAAIDKTADPDATLKQVADAIDAVRLDLVFGKTPFHGFNAREKALMGDLLTAFTCVADYRRLRHLYPRVRLGPVPAGERGLVGFQTGRGIVKARIRHLVRLGRAWVQNRDFYKAFPAIVRRVRGSPMRELLFFRLGSELLAGSILLKDDKPRFKRILRETCQAMRGR